MWEWGWVRRSRPGGLPPGVLRTTTAAWQRLGSLRASMPPKWQPALRHLPNALSLFRLIAGPAMVAASWETRPGIAFCAMFVLGGLSDGADGYLARKYDLCSDRTRCPGAPPNASQLALDHMPAGRATGHLGGVSGQAAIWAASMP